MCEEETSATMPWSSNYEAAAEYFEEMRYALSASPVNYKQVHV